MTEYGIDMEKYSIKNEDYDGITNQKEVQKRLINIAIENSKLSLYDGLPVQITPIGHLYIGSIGAAYNLQSLQNAGITHILCLSDCIFLKYAEYFIYRRVVIQDNLSFRLVDRLEECFEFIEEGKSHVSANGNEGKVLVHCYQGKSRCGAVCCAYLMKYYQLKWTDALLMIQQARPQVHPNSGFVRQLQEFEEQLFQVSSNS